MFLYFILCLLVQNAICVLSSFYHCSLTFCVVFLLLDHVVIVKEKGFSTDLPIYTNSYEIQMLS